MIHADPADTSRSLRDLGGKVFLLTAVVQALLIGLSVAFLLHADGPRAITMGNFERVVLLLLGNVAYCVLAWRCGRSAARWIFELERNALWVGPVMLIWPSLLAAVVGTLVYDLMEDYRSRFFSYRWQEDIVWPVLGLFGMYLFFSIFWGMIAGYITKVFGQRKLDLVKEQLTDESDHLEAMPSHEQA